MVRCLASQLDMDTAISIMFSTSREKNAVKKALIADNVSFPVGLSMEIDSKAKYGGNRMQHKVERRAASALVIQISSEGQVGTFLNTLDELLENISVATKVIC